ncbi:hypothetical protein GCM10010524_29330 [Streptomyces mexicanus]
MVLVAVLLLPLVAVLLLVMDQVEQRVCAPAPRRSRHAARRTRTRLRPRLFPGGRRVVKSPALKEPY